MYTLPLALASTTTRRSLLHCPVPIRVLLGAAASREAQYVHKSLQIVWSWAPALLASIGHGQKVRQGGEVYYC